MPVTRDSSSPTHQDKIEASTDLIAYMRREMERMLNQLMSVTLR